MSLSSQTIAMSGLKEEIYQLQCDVDEVQQYLRRDCLEITGIPFQRDEEPAKIITEMCSAMEIDVKDHEISIAHRLPDTKSAKDRLIVKFVQRTTKDKIYNNRKKIQGKSAKNLPSFKGNQSSPRLPRIFINESLTSYRKKLFNKMYNFKKNNNFKYIWTINGKIYLKQDDLETSYGFTTLEEFEIFRSDFE